ncbi:hypothetical protein MNBD_NITROSPINAE05-1438 [hydrothermal vent metagenome]|uniref:Uncharacterized protein n=1 Tax=hydrothermal vent metagenome TaxID=652676 RepID=A0A3B1D6K1_9ZZZZ
MIDWDKASPEDFKLQMEVESIQESGESIIFPVRVYHKDGDFAFLKSVPIRAEFYRALRKTPDWQKALAKIFRQRVKDDVISRTKTGTIAIEDKIAWITK